MAAPRSSPIIRHLQTLPTSIRSVHEGSIAASGVAPNPPLPSPLLRRVSTLLPAYVLRRLAIMGRSNQLDACNVRGRLDSIQLIRRNQISPSAASQTSRTSRAGLRPGPTQNLLDSTAGPTVAEVLPSVRTLTLQQMGLRSTNLILSASISALPLPFQSAFRRKMMIVFDLQLLVVWCLVSVMCFSAAFHRQITKRFAEHYSYALVTFAIALGCMVLLYTMRERFPYNWLCMILFSLALAVFYVGIGSQFGSYIPWYGCAFTFFEVLLLSFFVTIRLNSSEVRPQTNHTITSTTTSASSVDIMATEESLMSPLHAGLAAYAIVGAVAIVLFLVLRNEHFTFGKYVGDGSIAWEISLQGFVYLMVLQLLLVVWFCYDASCMLQVLTPDEYMRCIIYFYTDLVVVALFLVLFVVVGASCTVLSCSACRLDCFECIVCCCTCGKSIRRLPHTTPSTLDRDVTSTSRPAHAMA